jgi:hypothetical protein
MLLHLDEGLQVKYELALYNYSASSIFNIHKCERQEHCPCLSISDIYYLLNEEVLLCVYEFRGYTAARLLGVEAFGLGKALHA